MEKGKMLEAVDYEVRGYPEFEEIKFSDLSKLVNGEQQFLGQILMGYMPQEAADKIFTTETDFDKLRVKITVNDVPVLHTQFQSMCSEFSGLMYTHRLDAAGFEDFENAVGRRARETVDTIYGDIIEKSAQLTEAMSRLTDDTLTKVETECHRSWKEDKNNQRAARAAAIEEVLKKNGIENSVGLALEILVAATRA